MSELKMTLGEADLRHTSAIRWFIQCARENPKMVVQGRMSKTDAEKTVRQLKCEINRLRIILNLPRLNNDGFYKLLMTGGSDVQPVS